MKLLYLLRLLRSSWLPSQTIRTSWKGPTSPVSPIQKPSPRTSRRNVPAISSPNKAVETESILRYKKSHLCCHQRHLPSTGPLAVGQSPLVEKGRRVRRMASPRSKRRHSRVTARLARWRWRLIISRTCASSWTTFRRRICRWRNSSRR